MHWTLDDLDNLWPHEVQVLMEWLTEQHAE